MSLKPAPKRLERTHPPGIQDTYKKDEPAKPKPSGLQQPSSKP
jgi:hypothetical protein